MSVSAGEEKFGEVQDEEIDAFSNLLQNLDLLTFFFFLTVCTATLFVSPMSRLMDARR
jgi:hypothetical protein